MRINNQIQILLLALVLAACSSPPGERVAIPAPGGQTVVQTLELSDLKLGTEIKASGTLLMEQPHGFIRVERGGETSDSVLSISIHGYESRGYEWVTALHGLTEQFGLSYFYHYDWRTCPQEAAVEFNRQLNLLVEQHPTVDRLIIFSHSYGGVVATFAASGLSAPIDTEVHIIAAPLAGYPRLMDHCPDLQYGAGDKLVYPAWDQKIRVIQHRTVHHQDGAFKDLAIDPQLVDLPFTEQDLLPPTMEGHRLGHNWSVTWVVDSFLGKAHRN